MSGTVDLLKYLTTNPFSYFTNFNLKLFKTTLTLENAISALAQVGVIWKSIPKTCKAPAAKGMHTKL